MQKRQNGCSEKDLQVAEKRRKAKETITNNNNKFKTLCFIL